MRRFNSYGPVDPQLHYCVPRTELIERAVEQLLGAAPHKAGHFFTIWAPRQTGKTWIMRRAMEEIRARHGERFLVKELSMQGISLKASAAPETFLSHVPGLFLDYLGLKVPVPADWDGFGRLFTQAGGLFDRPLVLLIDEFDRLPPAVIDELVGQFRGLKLRTEGSLLHGLALVGVRAVLGVDSDRGSPFNVQRALQVPNLTRDEAVEMFRQFQEEHGQIVEPAVVTRLFEVTRGQPGLVGWFGELLTEKYNPGAPLPIAMSHWDRIYRRACRVEPNNTVLNLLKKARAEPSRSHVVALFKTSNIPFSYDQDWCNYLFLNGIIDEEEVTAPGGEILSVCRFTSPFVQHRLYNAFADDMAALSRTVPTVDVMDDLTEVFARLDLPALLGRYRDFLKRLKRSGQNPWHGHPGRSDLHLREAVGHFHLYWWLMEASGRIFTITPEFPTGNGKVDLHIRHAGRTGVIEVKSFTQRWELPLQRQQAARYAHSRQLDASTLALFVPSDDEEVLAALSCSDTIEVEGAPIHVTTVAIAAV